MGPELQPRAPVSLEPQRGLAQPDPATLLPTPHGTPTAPHRPLLAGAPFL